VEQRAEEITRKEGPLHIAANESTGAHGNKFMSENGTQYRAEEQEQDGGKGQWTDMEFRPLPPLLTGGLRMGGKSLLSAGMDYLTLSCSAAYAHALFDTTENSSATTKPAFKGFGSHEFRGLRVGQVARHWDPHSKRSRWGEGYECWNFTGTNANYAVAEHVVQVDRQDRRATRIDVAFDFACEDTLTPNDCLNAWRDVWEGENMMTSGVSGQGEEKSWTRYIGSISSPRRIRIYRKDIESGSDQPPVMRVELVLKADYANGLLTQFCADHQGGLLSAAAHVYAMTGFRPTEGIGEVPEREVKPTSTVGRKAAVCAYQFGALLSVLDELGMLGELLEYRKRKMSQAGVYRLAKLRELALDEGAEAVLATAKQVLANEL